MSGWLKAIRARVMRAGGLAYLYAPLSQHWKDRAVRFAFRVGGSFFAGERYYELWRQRGAAPRPAPGDTHGPRILVVDRYVPQPDRDAGSRSIWCMLRALRHMGFAVTFWPADLLYDPHYVPPLEREGIEVIWGDEWLGRLDAWLARHGAAYDYVVLSRPLVAKEALPSVRRHSRAKVLFAGCDMHHARLAREYELTGAESLRWESTIMRRIETRLWHEVDVVYYPSSEETRAVRAALPGVSAWTLPLYFFDDEPAALRHGPNAREGITFVAGFAHGPNVDAAKWLVAEVMPRVWSVRPDVHLSLVGSRPTREVQGLAGARVAVTGYVSDEELLRFYRTTRVAVVPLRVGAGMKGKVVEALYHGVPLVTTPVGAQGLDELPPIVCVTMDPAAFADRVVALLADDELWETTSQSQREYAHARFSLQAMEEVLRLGMAPNRR
jgi:glycosyltransferase involved in cell wall biosynthesis